MQELQTDSQQTQVETSQSMNGDMDQEKQNSNSEGSGGQAPSLDSSKSIMSQAMGGELGQSEQAGQDGQQGGDDSGDSPAVPGSPEEYQFEFKPETQIDQELLGGFQQWAHKAGLPMDQARDLVQMFENRMLEQGKAIMEQRRQQQLAWRESMQKDPEFLRNLNGNMAALKRGVEAYKEPELMAALEQTGLIDHPAVVKLFLRLGNELAEPGIMRGGTGERRDLTNDEFMQEAGWSGI